jgi:hypothetical protein
LLRTSSYLINQNQQSHERIYRKKQRSITAAGVCLLIAGITMSFQPLQFGPIQHYDSLSEPGDTIPSKKEWHEKMTMKEYDELMKNLDVEMKKAMEEVSA